MTYLQLVNSVLTRLRENTVDTVERNPYSKLIGELVKDSIINIENSWDWSHLRTTVAATTEPNAISSTLTGCKESTEFLNVVCEEGNNFVRYKPASWFTNAYLNIGVTSGKPMYYCPNGVDESGDVVVDIYPSPDGVYNVYFNVVKRTDVSTLIDSTRIVVPTYPIIMLAYAFAIRERGEQSGDSVNEQIMIARSALADSISIDASRNPEDLEWYTV
jgi:hypothetical protein